MEGILQRKAILVCTGFPRTLTRVRGNPVCAETPCIRVETEPKLWMIG